MTIPNLIAKINFIALKAQFKKEYSQIQSTLKLMNEDGEFACYREVGTGNTYNNSECVQFWEQFLSYRKESLVCKAGDYTCRPKYKTRVELLAEGATTSTSYCSLNTNDYEAHVMLNGVIYYLWRNQVFPNYFVVDVNGKAGPNKYGYDVFYLTLYKDIRSDKPVQVKQDLCWIIEKGGYNFDEMLK